MCLCVRVIVHIYIPAKPRSKEILFFLKKYDFWTAVGIPTTQETDARIRTCLESDVFSAAFGAQMIFVAKLDIIYAGYVSPACFGGNGVAYLNTFNLIQWDLR